MRLPFPTRISVQKALLFAAVVICAQLLEHTDPVFAILFFAYIMLSTLAFNIAGGFSRASGTYIFSFATLTAIIGVLWKIVLGEPGDSNLTAPNATLGTYVLGMAMMIVALFFSHRIIGKSRGLPALVRTDKVNLGLASIGCLIANQITVWANEFLPHGSGSLVNAINQASVFLPLGIILGTVHTIRTTGGRRSVNLVTIYSMGLIFVFSGLIYYSKQGMFTPFICWLVAAASQRYRLRPWQVAALGAFAVYSIMILSPLSQVGRANVPEDADNWKRAELTTDLLTHPKRLRAEAGQDAEPLAPGEVLPSFQRGYFDTPQGLLDRLNMISADDRLVAFTLQGHTDGYQRLIFYFINWIPHFIFPAKDQYAPPGGSLAGNYYAHEMGTLLSPDDTSTGISFSPTAEAFHLEGWLGIGVLAPIVWILVFTTVDLICGDLRESPFGLIAAVLFAHTAPESLLSGLIQFVWTGNIAIIVATVFSTYFAPVLGALFAGPQEYRYSKAPESALIVREA
jgi:hypothetical protein